MIDDLRQIAIFAKTADLGSFRKAAAELRLSPSVVSHHISQLESKLGVALLYRTTRRLSLTGEGERLLTAGRAMLEAAESGLNALQETADEPQGTIRVTIPSVLSPSPLAERISSYCQCFPRVALDLEFSDERRDLIADHFDVAIRMGPGRKRAANRRSLFHARRLLVASSGYLAGQDQILAPKDLERLEGIDFAPARLLNSRLRKEGAEDASFKLKTQITVNDAQALYQLARTGSGVAAVPEFLATEDLASGKVCHLLPDWELDRLEVFAEWPASAPKGGIVRSFVDALSAPLSKS